MSNSVDPDEMAHMSRLIWNYAVCKSLLLLPVAVKELTYLFINLNKNNFLPFDVSKVFCLCGRYYRPLSDDSFHGVWTSSTMFAQASLSKYLGSVYYCNCLCLSVFFGSIVFTIKPKYTYTKISIRFLST